MLLYSSVICFHIALFKYPTRSIAKLVKDIRNESSAYPLFVDPINATLRGCIEGIEAIACAFVKNFFALLCLLWFACFNSVLVLSCLHTGFAQLMYTQSYCYTDVYGTVVWIWSMLDISYSKFVFLRTISLACWYFQEVGGSAVGGVYVLFTLSVNFRFVNSRIMDEVYDVIVLGTGLKVSDSKSAQSWEVQTTRT